MNSAHPRGCGEQALRKTYDLSLDGSSPRVRGTGRPAVLRVVPRRLIPAGAGNSCVCPCFSRSTTAHPRGCGEQPNFVFAPVSSCGSSPRVRGTVCGPASRTTGTRLIPAGAGNSSSSRWRGGQSTAHPRGCGEQGGAAHSSVRFCGSSPRVRGTDRPAGLCAGLHRLIPAGAGNRRQAAGCPQAGPAHPRGCGEQAGCSPSHHRISGSSPRVRGTGQWPAPASDYHRLIPAGAGNRFPFFSDG